MRAASGLILLVLLAPSVQAEDELVIQVQHGYGNAQHFVVEGRVVEKRGDRAPGENDSRLRNLWRNLRLLVNDEAEAVRVQVLLAGRTFETRTDREGYFRVSTQTPPGIPLGWNPLMVHAPDKRLSSSASVLIVPPANRLGVISDFDDTLIVSHVLDKSKLLKLSLVRNPAQREAAPGMAAFLRRQASRNPEVASAPVFYLSASPRQIQSTIQLFLDRHGFPRGVLLAKKVTNDNTSDPLRDQVRYKTGRIETLLRELPGIRFVLIGDDGEKDPEIYHDIRTRFPDRVAEVWIRRVHTDPRRARYPLQRLISAATGP